MTNLPFRRRAGAVAISLFVLSAVAHGQSVTARRTARAANLLLVGLSSSAPLVSEFFYNPASMQMGGTEYTAFMQTHLRTATKVMPVVNLLALASYAPLLWFDRREPTRPAVLLAAASAVLLAATVVITILTEAPVDAAFLNADPASPPADWERIRANWVGTQPLRTGFALSASLTALAAMVLAE